jgi:hypothetical protein
MVSYLLLHFSEYITRTIKEAVCQDHRPPTAYYFVSIFRVRARETFLTPIRPYRAKHEHAHEHEHGFCPHGHVSRNTRTVRCARLGRTTNTLTSPAVCGLLIPAPRTRSCNAVFRLRSPVFVPTNTSTPHEHVLSVRGLRSTVGGLLLPALRTRARPTG